jgi:hypothetical protein
MATFKSPCILDKEEIIMGKRERDWYFNKFGQKMRGTRKPEAKGWVEGAGLSKKDTRTLWARIQRNYYPSRKRRK